MKPWNLNTYDAFFLDVDGVLVHDSKPIEGAIDAYQALRLAGQVLILTNNSTRSRHQHAERLTNLGFPVQANEVVSSSFVIADYLLKTEGQTIVWPIGESGLTEELRASGHQIASVPEQARWVVAGMDRTFNYQKIALGLRALRSGARLAATNLDGTYPTPDGPMPGAGAIVGALCGMEFEADVHVGKPETMPYDIAMDQICVEPSKILMIGDRLGTDILGGIRSGLDTLLVLTGISTEAEMTELGIRPTWLTQSVSTMIEGKVSRL